MARPPELASGASVERQLGVGETHEYRIAAEAGWYLRLGLVKGEDVSVTLLGPAGDTLARVDEADSKQESELLSLVTPAAGEVRVIVASQAPQVTGYTVRLEELRQAGPQDGERVAAEATVQEAKRKRLDNEEGRRQALALLEEALPRWRIVGDREGEAETLNLLGGIHNDLGETQAALALFERALPLAREAGSGMWEAQTLNNLGMAYRQAGDTQKAIDAYRESLGVWEALGKKSEAGTVLQNMAVVLIERLDFDEAQAYLNRALELHREVGSLSGQAFAHVSLGVIHREQGDIEAALSDFDQALGLAHAAGNSSAEASVLLNAASLDLRRSELQKALELYEKALGIYRASGERFQEGKVLSSLGTASLYLGDSKKALDYYTQALEIYTSLKNSTWQVFALRDLGGVYYLQGDSEKALEYHARAYELSLSGNDLLSRAAALCGMGRARLALDDPRQALRELEEARTIFEEKENALGQINVLLDLGRAWRALSDDKRAEGLFLQALELSRRSKAPLAEAISQSALARLARDRGDLPAAVSAIEQSLRIFESVRPNIAVNRLRVSFFASRREYYEFYVDLLMRLSGRDTGGERLAEALAASEKARARGLLDLLAEGRIDVQSGITPELKRRESEIVARIAFLQSRMLDELSGKGNGALRGADLEVELDRAEESRERLEGQIRKEHPRYAAVRDPIPLKVGQIQELLDDQTALLEYSIGVESSYLFVVTREGLSGYPLPPAAELAKLVDSLRQTLREPSRLMYARYIDTAQRLYQILIAPALSSVGNRRHLIISPDGPLLLLSFEALLTAPPNTGGTGSLYRDLPYLIRERSVTYVPSASVFAELVRLRPEAAEHVANKEFLGFGDPDYGDAGTPSASGSPERPAGSVERLFQAAGLTRLPRLAASRQEVLDIAALYSPELSEVHLGAEASEYGVKHSPFLKSARRIHFAVHGLLDPQQPARSGLVLTREGNLLGEDGLLQVYEIFNLELDADLIVLSACDTGLGSAVAGEGLIGVTRAFLYAGAASVVVSLWQVSDTSTSELMVSFYRHLNETEDTAEALRLAKLDLISRGIDHPYHWAPFILIGRPR